MYTLLPIPDYSETAVTLDRDTLRNQRMAVLKILNCLHEIDGFEELAENPAVKMWRGYEPQLCEFGITLCDEWIKRGNLCDVKPEIETHLDWATAGSFVMTKPDWFGDTDLHLSHQSLLLRLDATYYRGFFPATSDELEIVWPD
jgi:hypothetical protein